LALPDDLPGLGISGRKEKGALSVKVAHGLPEHCRPQAARLYWQAFGSKLGRVLGPEPKALAFLERVIQADHCLYALGHDGSLIGLAGFKTPRGSFSGGGADDLRSVYGQFGGLWRAFLLRLLQSEVDNERFLVDGICVAREWRGHGVGTALIDALFQEARWRGYPAIRLEVIEANVRARALYERMGFTVWRTETLGLLRHVFGFSRSTTMLRDLR
jgi:ribosomal protein S18 acetylase RimI-like enzyme